MVFNAVGRTFLFVRPGMRRLAGEVCDERFRRVDDGAGVCRVIVVVRRVVRRIDGRPVMNGSEVIGLVLSVGLLVYLVIALLKPEWFA
jgi:K+-transporting ATPase KdpF subunit